MVSHRMSQYLALGSFDGVLRMMDLSSLSAPSPSPSPIVHSLPHSLSSLSCAANVFVLNTSGSMRKGSEEENAEEEEEEAFILLSDCTLSLSLSLSVSLSVSLSLSLLAFSSVCLR